MFRACLAVRRRVSMGQSEFYDVADSRDVRWLLRSNAPQQHFWVVAVVRQHQGTSAVAIPRGRRSIPAGTRSIEGFETVPAAGARGSRDEKVVSIKSLDRNARRL